MRGAETEPDEVERDAHDLDGGEREQLCVAALALQRSRASVSWPPREPVAGWRTMERAGWSLVDDFQRDGKRYLVAVREDGIPGRGVPLTSREREVVELAMLGRSSKVIAYELGIASSTVRVLLARGLGKLGLRSRGELVAGQPPSAREG